MFCVHCGRENPDDADFCYRCGTRTPHEATPLSVPPLPAAPDPATGPAGGNLEDPLPPPAQPEYARMFVRLQAFCVDLLVWLFLVVAVAIAMAALGVPTPTTIEWFALSYLVLAAYMTGSESTCSASLGKWMFRLRIAPAAGQPDSRLRFIGRVLLRETLGRFLGCFFFCAGYWFANSQAQHQALTDSVAGTVVLRTGYRRRRAVTLAVIGLTVYLLTFIVPPILQQRNVEHKALRARVRAAASSVAVARSKVHKILVGPAHSPTDLQRSMSALQPALDTYDARMRAYVHLVTLALHSGAYSGKSSDIMRASLAAVALREDQSAILRREARIVVAYDPAKESWKSVAMELAMLNSDVHADDVKVAPMMKTMDGSRAPQR